MHAKQHPVIYRSAIAAIALVVLNTMLISTNVYATASKVGGDPTHGSKLREVLVSQQLFVTKFSPGKRKHCKGYKDINFKAEMKGVFMVVEMAKDTDHVVTDWIRCPESGCPTMGTYSYGTAGYRKLDTMMAVSKKNSLLLQKRSAAIVVRKK